MAYSFMFLWDSWVYKGVDLYTLLVHFLELFSFCLFCLTPICCFIILLLYNIVLYCIVCYFIINIIFRIERKEVDLDEREVGEELKG